MPPKQQTPRELRVKLRKRYGEKILRDFIKAGEGNMAFRELAKKYGMHQSYPSQVYRKLFPGTKKKCKPRDNKEYLKDKLGGCNRGRIEGFKKYYAQNQYLFKDIFKTNYSDQAAEQEFRKMGL